uniref:Uncharacterized protein n=1 Tax=Ditylenchus dipsaci TaxID=166011 RepID=A0A915E2Y8_9BILA
MKCKFAPVSSNWGILDKSSRAAAPAISSSRRNQASSSKQQSLQQLSEPVSLPEAQSFQSSQLMQSKRILQSCERMDRQAVVLNSDSPVHLCIPAEVGQRPRGIVNQFVTLSRSSSPVSIFPDKSKRYAKPTALLLQSCGQWKHLLQSSLLQANKQFSSSPDPWEAV